MKRTKILIGIFLFLLWLFSIPVAWENGNVGKIIHIILLIGILHYLTHEYKYKEPYIIGNSNKIEYLTEEELKERLGCEKDIEP